MKLTNKISAGHTPGPWEIQTLETSHHGYDDWPTFAVRSSGGNNCLAVVGEVDRFTAERNEANARLIAAAPDLLAALEPFAELCDSARCAEMGEYEATTFVLSAKSMLAARAAFAKATGDAQ